MNSDLIVMTFTDGQMAQTVRSSLRAMRQSAVLGLNDSVIMTKDGAGQLRLYPGAQESTGLAGQLADLILRSPDRVIPALDGVELDDGFVNAVLSALRRNCSAILIFLDSGGLNDRVELLNALALFQGTIHQTTLAPPDQAPLRGMP
jgi:uncharacterized membrane protein